MIRGGGLLKGKVVGNDLVGMKLIVLDVVVNLGDEMDEGRVGDF